MDKYKDGAILYIKRGQQFIQMHAAILFALIFASLTGFIIVQSGTHINREPTALQITEKQAEIKPIRIDEKSLEVVEELISRNIDLESVFIERYNPFEN